MIWIVAFHCDGVLVTTPLVIRRCVGDVDRREVIQVFAVSFCPPVRQLRSSVLLVILPPAQDRGIAFFLFPCSSHGFRFFPMILLPWSISVSLSS